MTNQQLLDFIKQQLQAGFNKEKISSELLANGWTMQDIEESFKTIGVPAPVSSPVPASVASVPVSASIPVLTQNSVPNFSSINRYISSNTPKVKSHSGRNMFLVIFILLLLVCGASIYYFRNELINLPLIRDIFPVENIPQDNVLTPSVSDTTQQQNSPVQNSDTGATSQTGQLDNTAPAVQPVNPNTTSLSVYTDPDGLYSFNYPQGAEINYKGKYPSVYMTIPQWDNNPMIIIVSDVNNTAISSLSLDKNYQKSSLGKIGDYPFYKYINASENYPNVYKATYAIDLGVYNNKKLSIVFVVLASLNGPDGINQIEKIIKSFVINKNNIASAIAVLSSRLDESQKYFKDMATEQILGDTKATAELFFQKSNSYAGFCKSSEYVNATKSIVKPMILSCKDSASAYAVMASISSGYWCIDNTGYNDASSANTGTVCVK